jgi:hypothetical protein
VSAEQAVVGGGTGSGAGRLQTLPGAQGTFAFARASTSQSQNCHAKTVVMAASTK